MVLTLTVVGFYICFEDDSVEFAKFVRQWNVKIILAHKTLFGK